MNEHYIAQLKTAINTDYSARFLNDYYGRFFSGDITLIEAAYIWTLSFHRGQCIDYIHGIPHSGIDIGVKGDHKAWAQFFTHKSLSVATNRGNVNNLEILGGAIRFRQNFNVVAQLIRTLALIMEQGR